MPVAKVSLFQELNHFKFEIMTRFLFVTGFLLSTMLVFSSFKILENQQDLKNIKKTQKHIKLLKIDDEGNKTELDTVIENDDVFVWNGDTIATDDEWTWVFDNDFHPDSVLEKLDFDFEIEEGDSGETIVMKSRKGKPFMHRFKFDKDFPPRPPLPPAPPKIFHIEKSKRSNVIDLSDPGIVSFKKSKKKDGLEKITIIRKEPDEKGAEVMEEH
jgi:hypothetical protein